MTEDSRIAPISRRDLLRFGLGGVALLSGCGRKGGQIARPALAAASRLNDWVGERLLLSPSHLAPTYALAERTPEHAFPAYFISRPVPVLEDPAAWSLELGGLIAKPQRLTLAMLQALPRITYTVKHHCVEGWSAIGTWTGVPFATIAALAEPLPAARFLRFDSFDKNYYNGFDLKSAMHPQTILAYAFNDRPLTPQRGAPLRLYSPVKLGYKMTKYLTRIDWTAERPGGYWEDRGYPWFGGI
ncbi:MAG TPA: molybdopterin-dependent oxidoreductase [Thermoanaerobaculia bacterium]|jgi:DMSO/TMAO reductase YedYZ molybdopterin-dependent catalytic subunit|nr:molybdopterin-dependent oxidoreductase [Thermoanaerobaculia bacterium]